MNFLDADYSAIEARIVNWLAGQEDALEEYRQGVDRYKRMASVIYGVPEEQVNKHPQRFIGKQCILLCGFQGGPDKFRFTCEKFGYKDMPEGLEEKAVYAFRRKHPRIKQSWDDIDLAAKEAILKPGEITSAAKCNFLVKKVEGMPFLLLKLPSGRKLAYPKPRIVTKQVKIKTKEGPKVIVRDVITFFGHRIGTQWGDVETYGGKLLENATQAVAADIMANGAHNAEREGYQIATLIHDQAIAYHREGQTPEEFVSLLTKLPDWAAGLPIEAEGSLVPFYRKD